MNNSATAPLAPAAPVDRLAGLSKPPTPVAVRERLIDLMRRDLVGPHPDLDPDLAREVLSGSSPSNWYLTGYLGPRRKTDAARRLAATTGSAAAAGGGRRGLARGPARQRGHGGRRHREGRRAGDGSAERPPVRSFEPSSLGLTVLLPREARELKARVTWGDYVTEPRLDDSVFLPDAREAAEARGEKPKAPPRNTIDWRRIPREALVTIPLNPGDEPKSIAIPDSAAPMAPGGGLELVVSARPTVTADIDGVKRELLAVSVFLVNSRPRTLRRFGDVAFCFQARLQLDFAARLRAPRRPRLLRRDGFRRTPRRPALPRRLLLRGRPQHLGRLGRAGRRRPRDHASSPIRCRRRMSRSSAPTSTFPASNAAWTRSPWPPRDAATLDAALGGLPVAYAAWAQAQARVASRIGGRAASRDRAEMPHETSRPRGRRIESRHRAAEGRRDQPRSLRHHEPRDGRDPIASAARR